MEKLYCRLLLVVVFSLLLVSASGSSENTDSRAQQFGNGVIHFEDSLLRNADSLLALGLYEEAVPYLKKASWKMNLQDWETLFIPERDRTVQAMYIKGLVYRNNYHYFDLQKSTEAMINAAQQRYRPALEMLADYYINLKVPREQESFVLNLLQEAVIAGDTFLTEPLRQRKVFDSLLTRMPPSQAKAYFWNDFEATNFEDLTIPCFPGGQDSLSAFLRNEIHYIHVDERGSSIVQFVVDKDGGIRESKISVSLNPDCDREALRGVLLLPRWIPAHDRDRYVKCLFQVPITFVAEKER